MVNGKPNLTFGSTPPSAATARRQKSTRNSGRAAENFASYLPGLDTGTKSNAPSQQAAIRAPRSAHVPAQAHNGFLPGSPGAAPAGYAGTANLVKDRQARASLPAAQPSGRVSRAEARAQAAPGAPGMAASHMRGNTAMQPQYLNAKNSPRISTDRPITGRRDIGMTDTRKTLPARSTLSGRGAMNYASPNANAAQAGAMGMGRQSGFTSGGAPAADSYSSFSSYHSGLANYLGQQSFLTHGFASRNAELALKKLGYDMRENRNIVTRATLLDQDAVSHGDNRAYAAGSIFGSTRPIEREGGDDAARTAVQTASHRRRHGALPAGAYPGNSLVNTFHAAANKGLGSLAAKFESGEEGIAAIGYDSKGGTSYGKYQIASRVGTMSAFLTYLESKAPDFAARLKAAGPANTGGRNGKMPAEWRKIASEDPARFEHLQSDFIRTSHFEPAMQAIAAATGVAFEKLPAAYQEVLFSTAVQHGPSGATRIISQALQRVDAGKLRNQKTPSARKTGEQLITHIYDLRAGQFVSSSSRVQSSVRSRLKQEMREALQMLS